MRKQLKTFLARAGKKDANTTPAVEDRKAGKTPQGSAATDANRVDISEANRSQNPIKHVHLEPFLKEQHEDPGIAEAQQKLQKATEELEATLRDHASKSRKFPNIEDSSAKLAIEAAISNQSNPAAAFGNFIEQILANQEEDKGTISGKIAGYMARLYPVANLALGLISFSADAAGFLPLKITANGLSQVLTLAMSERSQSDIVTEQLEKLSRHLSFVENVRQINLDDSRQENITILANATNLLAAVANFLRISLIYLNKNFLRKAGETIVGKDNVMKSKEELDSAVEAFDRSVSRGADIARLRTQQDEENEKILRSLSDMDFEIVQKEIRSKRLRGTGEWIFKEPTFDKWLNGDISVLWCPGILLDHICPTDDGDSDRKSATTVGIAYVYCNYANQRQQTALGLIKSITRQLVQRDLSPEKSSSLSQTRKFQEKHKSIPPTIEDYTSLLASITERFKKTIVVIDALDECADLIDGHPNRKAFIKALMTVPELKLFITSRSLPAIRKLLPQASEQLPIHSNHDDVMSYLNWRIEESDKLKRHIKKEPALKLQILDVVKKKYSTLFILTRLLLDFIVDLDSIGIVQDALDSLPTTNEDFYGLCIDRINKQADPSHTGIKILLWILHSKRELSVKEVQHALAVEPGKTEVSRFRRHIIDDGNILVDRCAGLIVISSESRVVSFAHPTVKDYLDQDVVRNKLFPNAQIHITATCVTYLSLDAFDAGFCLTDEAFEARLQENALYSYAAQNWGHHAREASADVGQHQQLIINFLESEIKVSSCSQAMMVSKRYSRYSQRMPREMRGMHLAAFFGLRDTIMNLLKHEHDADPKDGFGRTPLSYASENGYETITKQLLARSDVEINSKSNYGWTPLSFALVGGHKAVVRQLLARNDVEIIPNFERYGLQVQDFRHLWEKRESLRESKGSSQVKVAVIGTGIDLGDFNGNIPYNIRSGRTFNFNRGRESPWWMTLDPHGSQMARLFLAFNPFCHLYIAKVSAHKADVPAIEQLAQAIVWATYQDVDIISTTSTSLGLDTSSEELDNAVLQAATNGIVFMHNKTDEEQTDPGLFPINIEAVQ
ncbi:ankyrin [Stipitochalara longipes BDJ]|nr:ankyrin [Stipitochalara longipes BDJ]